MAPTAEQGVAFLTAPPALAAAILQDARARFPGARWTVCHRAADRSALESALAGAELAELEGSTLSLLRALRRRRFDIAVVAWTGHRPYRRMKVLGLLAARRHTIYNENLDWFRIGVSDRSWLTHCRWRLRLPRGIAPSVVVLAFAAYRRTVGLLIGAAVIALRCARRCAHRQRSRP